MEKIKNFFTTREWAIVGLLVIVFVAIRLPGVHLPLHQDEYKWPMIVNPALGSEVSIPHPPLSQFIYRTAGYIVGFNVNFRFVPLFFGALNLVLLYYFLRIRFGKRVAIIGALLFTFSYFSILASLMIDTDGQIMPFFLLLSLIGYHKARLSSGREMYIWLGVMTLAMILGFFIKVSFILAIGAIVADFLWEKKSYITKADLIKYLGYILGGIIGLTLLLVISQYVFSFFSLEKAFVYWKHFAELNRNWFQTGIQVVKALFYTSPFLIGVPFFLSRNNTRELKPFLFFILFGMVFYTIIFDFSIGALDRYLQFLIVPLCAISAVVIDSVLRSDNAKRNKEYLLLGTAVSLVMILLISIPHFVPSLHPKSEWVSRVLSLRWNFLYPFSGGSGPLGFYVSFLFIGLSWIISIVLIVMGIVKPHLRKRALLILIPIGLVYNGIFAEEYLFGKMYGSAPRLLTPVVEYIKNNPEIQYVTVYNDNGGAEIQAIGKYRKRLYTDPAFDINDKIKTLNTYKEYYLEINIPRIDPNSIYRKYLDSCNTVYNQTDRYVSAKVYDCRGVKDITE
ncbi:MAG: 2 protein [Patescibacteria group bacterium]|nr:2 protein [Patescibacteria group bacterium]